MVRSGPATFGTNLAPDLSAPRADTSRRARRITVSRPSGADNVLKWTSLKPDTKKKLLWDNAARFYKQT